jgi:hypothetical protein
MQRQKIDVQKVTKPMQLLAAWIVGLILTNSSFLGAASIIEQPTWISGALVVASIINVPLFIIAIFVLQTRFRPEMQEDPFYSQYLASKTGGASGLTTESIESLRRDLSLRNNEVVGLIEQLQDDLSTLTEDIREAAQEGFESATVIDKIKKIEQNLHQTGSQIAEVKGKSEWTQYSIRVNKLLPNQKEIKAALEKDGIPIGTDIGSPKGNLPDSLVVSISDGFKMTHIKEILSILKTYGFQWIDYVSEQDRIYERAILIGSYVIDPHLRTRRFDDNFMLFLNHESTTEKDFYAHIKEK